MSHCTVDPESSSKKVDSSSSSPSSGPLAMPTPFHNTMPPPSLVAQGAEGHLFKTVFLDPSHPAALKIRPSKPYRHRVLDERLTKQRVLAEARVLVKLSKLGLGVPAVLSVDWRAAGRTLKGDSGAPPTPGGGGGAWLLMEWVDGMSVRRLLQERDRLQKASLDISEMAGEASVRTLLRRIGCAIGRMHSVGGVVHGDLTSSNIMVRPTLDERNGLITGNGHELSLEGEIVLIDFGLASQSIQDEDRAVDLYVLERAFGSTHPKQETMFCEEVLESQEGYRGSFKGSRVVLQRLEEVRSRGRKRSMVG